MAGSLAALGNGGRLVVVGVAAHDLVVPVPRILFEGVTPDWASMPYSADRSRRGHRMQSRSPFLSHTLALAFASAALLLPEPTPLPSPRRHRPPRAR